MTYILLKIVLSRIKIVLCKFCGLGTIWEEWWQRVRFSILVAQVTKCIVSSFQEIMCISLCSHGWFGLGVSQFWFTLGRVFTNSKIPIPTIRWCTCRTYTRLQVLISVFFWTRDGRVQSFWTHLIPVLLVAEVFILLYNHFIKNRCSKQSIYMP